jgi:hypothetical protein
MAVKKVPKTKVKVKPPPGKRAAKKKTPKTSKKVKTATPKTATPKATPPSRAAERLVRNKGIPHKKKVIALLALLLAYGTYKVASPIVGKYLAARAGETVDPLVEAIRAKAQADALAQAAKNSKAAANAVARAEALANAKHRALWAAGGIAKIVEKVGGAGLRLGFGLTKGTAKLALDNPITRTLINVVVIYPIILYTLHKTVGLRKTTRWLAKYAWMITKWILGKALKNMMPGVWKTIKATLAAGAAGGVYAAAGAVGGIANLIGELLKKILGGSRGGSSGGGGALMVRSPSSAYTTPAAGSPTPSSPSTGSSSAAYAIPAGSSSPGWNPDDYGGNGGDNPGAPRRKRSSHAEKEIANDLQAEKINQYRKWLTPRRSRSRSPQPGPSSAQQFTMFSTPVPTRIGGNAALGRTQTAVGWGGPVNPYEQAPSMAGTVALVPVLIKILGKAGTTGKQTAIAVLGAMSGAQKARLRSVMQYVGVQGTASVVASILKQPLNIVLAVLTRFFFGKAKMA